MTLRTNFKKLMTLSLITSFSFAGISTAQDYVNLAKQGKFDQLATSIDSTDDSQIQALTKDLRQFKSLQGERDELQAKEYKEAFDEMLEHIKEKKYEDALLSAIKAHDESLDAESTLQTPEILKLVKLTKAKAEIALKEHKWVDAWTMYSLLNRLYLDQKVFDKQVKKAAEHVRITRFYAPEKLQELFNERAERLGNDKPDPMSLGEETWEKQLSDVEFKMYILAMVHAKKRHIYNTDYKTMFLASLVSLENLLETETVHSSLANLKDKHQVLQFQKGIDSIRDFIKSDKSEFDRTKLFAYLDYVIRMNNNTVKLQTNIMAYEMAEAAMHSLDDYSSVIWPHETAMFLRTLQGNFKGIGVQIRMNAKNELTVITPLLNSPAYRAGFKAGDIITHVDDKNISSWTLDQAIRKITGPEHSKVKISTKRKIKSNKEAKKSDDDSKDKTAKKDDKDKKEDTAKYKVHEHSLKRSKIAIESVKGWELQDDGKWDYYVDRKNKIGYIRVSQFLRQSTEDLQKAVDQMQQDQGMNALILDLRYNPGGLLMTAISMVDKFVDNGTIVSTKDKDKNTNYSHPATASATKIRTPVVVLINQGSASASEIVSGALQDLGRAYIVGENSFGKGSVQNTNPFPNRIAPKWLVKITTEYYALPSGRIIHRMPNAKKWGIQPDLTVAMTPTQLTKRLEARQAADVLKSINGKDSENEDNDTARPSANDILAKGLDPQLDAAMLILKTILMENKLKVAKN